MALSMKRVVSFLLAMSLLQAINATVHKVGDSAGWTSLGHVDYQKWAASNSFKVGDTILFEYNAQFHSVLQVTHANYRACNTSAPLANYTTGNDSITITTVGHHFFFCGTPGHCQGGQKVDINVPRNGAPNPAAAPYALSPAPYASAPGPSRNNAMALKSLKSSFGYVLGLAIAVSQCLYSISLYY